MNILIFGDSITYGKWDTEGGWADRLRHYYDTIAIKELSRGYPSIYNIGISGDMASGILYRFEMETEIRKREEELILIFAIGTNDSLLDRGTTQRCTPEEFKSNLEAIIEKAKKHTTKILLVGLSPVDEERTTPVFWRDVHYTNERIKKFDRIVQEVAQNNRLKYVPIFDELQKKAKEDKNILPDGLHPNDEGHELIFQQVRPALDSLLNT